MQRIITGATGLIGSSLVNHWLSQGHEIIAIGRSKEKIQHIFQDRIKAKLWDTLQPEDFEHAEVVVNLAGANIADQRWNEARKQEIIQSRVTATKKIISLLTALAKPPTLFNASALGIYGLQQSVKNGLPPALDENTPIDWNNPPDFLAKVGQEWEKATRVSHPSFRMVNLRFAVVLAKQGGALPMMARPFYFYMGGRVGSGQQPFSWIAIDDLMRAIDFLLTNDLSGPVNLAAPGCVTQFEFAKTLGNVLHKPSIMPAPAFMLKLAFGEMAEELLLEGQHIYPKRLLDSGFQFLYPDIHSALKHVLSN